MSNMLPEAEAAADLLGEGWEVETSALSPEQDGGLEPQPLMLSRLHRLLPCIPLWRHVLRRWAIVLSLLAALGIMVAQLEKASSTKIVLSTAPSTPLSINPLPAVLGAAPPYCLTAPAPQPVLPGISPVIGGAPLWIAGFDGPQATLYISTADPVLVTRYGWATDIHWIVGPSFTGALLVRGKNLSTGAPLWFRIPYQAAAPLLLLDTRASHSTSPLGKGWAEWLGEVYIRASGCYLLDITWPGGHRQMTFAAGRAMQPIIPPARYCRGQEAPCIPVGIPPEP